MKSNDVSTPLIASLFGWVSFAMIVGVMGTALISPLYALYQDAWQLKTSEVSLIYVVYMAGALCGLLFLGRLPDRLGFRPVMQAGLLLVLLGTLITLLAWEVWSLNAGRFVVGVALVFALGVTLTAIGHGMCQMTGIGMVNRIATNDTRAGLFSSYLVVGYVGTMIPMMGIGWIADHWGMEAALYTFCGSVVVIATVAALCFQRHPRMRGHDSLEAA